MVWLVLLGDLFKLAMRKFDGGETSQAENGGHVWNPIINKDLKKKRSG